MFRLRQKNKRKRSNNITNPHYNCVVVWMQSYQKKFFLFFFIQQTNVLICIMSLVEPTTHFGILWWIFFCIRRFKIAIIKIQNKRIYLCLPFNLNRRQVTGDTVVNLIRIGSIIECASISPLNLFTFGGLENGTLNGAHLSENNSQC